MKKIYFFSTGILFCVIISAQPVSNSSFESWSLQNLFNEPNGYTSSNMWTYMSNGSGNVKKIADAYHGMFAAKLETVFTGSDTIQGMLIIGSPGNQTVNGGVPFNEMPDSVSGYIKYNLQPNDTANFIVFFKKNGTMTGIAMKQFSGNVNSYTRFSVPVNYFGIAVDTVAVIISSSNMDPPQFPGSAITIDSISFIGAVQPFPNGDFENWTPVNSEEPDNWLTLNFAGISSGQISATKSTQSYDGIYALRLESIVTQWGDTIGFITNGLFGNDGPEGGKPVNANPQKLTGYYKYFPNGPDTALAGMWTYKYNSLLNSSIVLDSVVIHLTAASTYTYFEIPLTYNSNPIADTVNISFSSSNMEDSMSYSGAGSVLFIDKLNITYYNPSGEKDIVMENSVEIFPNPNNGNFTIYNSESAKFSLSIYNLLGELIYSDEIINRKFINVNLIQPSGIYFYKIVSENKVFTGKMMLEK